MDPSRQLSWLARTVPLVALAGVLVACAEVAAPTPASVPAVIAVPSFAAAVADLADVQATETTTGDDIPPEYNVAAAIWRYWTDGSVDAAGTYRGEAGMDMTGNSAKQTTTIQLTRDGAVVGTGGPFIQSSEWGLPAYFPGIISPLSFATNATCNLALNTKTEHKAEVKVPLLSRWVDSFHARENSYDTDVLPACPPTPGSGGDGDGGDGGGGGGMWECWYEDLYYSDGTVIRVFTSCREL